MYCSMGTRHVHPRRCTRTIPIGVKYHFDHQLGQQSPLASIAIFTKRLAREQHGSQRRPPLATNCIVKFASSPHGPINIISVAEGTLALDVFLAPGCYPRHARTRCQTLPYIRIRLNGTRRRKRRLAPRYALHPLRPHLQEASTRAPPSSQDPTR